MRFKHYWLFRALIIPICMIIWRKFRLIKLKVSSIIIWNNNQIIKVYNTRIKQIYINFLIFNSRFSIKKVSVFFFWFFVFLMTLLHEIVSSFPKNNFFPVVPLPFHASVGLVLCQCSWLFMPVRFGFDASVCVFVWLLWVEWVLFFIRNNGKE